MVTSNSISFKLFIDTKHERILFAEGGKDFADLLFSSISFSHGDAIKVLSNDGMVGSLAKIYGSLENLIPKYTLPNLDKDNLLQPCVAAAAPPGESTTAGEEGYVRDFTYMVMDDFEVKPLSTIAIFDVLSKFNIKDVGLLEEVVVHLGCQEGLNLLRESLLSNSNLSSIFLGGSAID